MNELQVPSSKLRTRPLHYNFELATLNLQLITYYFLRKYPAHARGLGDAADGEDVCARSHVRSESLGRGVDARARVRDCDDARAVLARDEASEVSARVAEAVDGDARVLQVHAAHAASLAHRVEAPARGGLASSLRAAERDGLARHDAEFRVAAQHRDGVHYPRHRLLVGVNVGRGDVSVGADDGRYLDGVAARQTFELAHRHGLRVADDSALAAAVRDVDGRALPSHPRRESFNLVERDVRVEAYAALRGAARDVVLPAVALEDADLAAVHLDGHRNDELPLRVPQDLPHRGIQ